jgi:hypothetical protein
MMASNPWREGFEAIMFRTVNDQPTFAPDFPGYTASPQGPDNYFETASAACGGYLRLR